MKVVIYGESGVGKTSLSYAISREFNLEKISVGSIMRNMADEEGISIYEFDELCKNNSEYDKRTDQKIQEIGRDSDNFVIEGRLAWYFVPDAISIKLTCSKEYVFERIAEREGIDLEEVKLKTNGRETAYKQRYAELYPHIEYPPLNENFDILLDTTFYTVEEAKEILLKKLYSFIEIK